MAKKFLTPKSQNVSDWYVDVILKAELADYAPVKGCMVIRPYGYALWEAIQGYMDRLIKQGGVWNAYFPLFIPESFLQKEKDHVEGFAPETAVVTHAGGEELKEKLIVRPTSETIMYEMYKQWTQSYKELPILINLWNNVVRWEKRTYLFLRTSEFLWQEGHCAHTTHEESWERVLWALQIYVDTYQNLMALYGIPGIKSDSERFKGGDRTLTYESLMPDMKALQSCTSHDLGQNFAKAFDWTVLDEKGGKLHPWQNSWGFSTRSIGGLIMAHGDDNGLILPPNIAPIQVVIVPIPGSSEKTIEFSKQIVNDELTHEFNITRDGRADESAGFKFNKWELKGVPVRVEVGDKEAAEGKLTLLRRDTMAKWTIPAEKLHDELHVVLEDIQRNLFEKHKKFTEENTHEVATYEEFKKIMGGPKGFISAFWCEDPKCEVKIKEETKATTRCLPINLDTGLSKEETGKCVYCGKDAVHRWLFAQAY